MTNDLKRIMTDLTPCPDPGRKDAYLRMYRRRTGSLKPSMWEMLRLQFTYINAAVWAVTLAVLFIAIWGSFMNRNVITGIAAMMPFVSGFAVFETFRSQMHAMTELEGVTLFSFRGIFFAKIVCIGSLHILLILLLSLMLSHVCRYDFLTTGILITIPYLISSVLSMEAERSSFGRKNPLVCLGISAFTSGLVLAASVKSSYFIADFTGIRKLLFLILIVLFLLEIKKTFQWEEYLWK